MHSIIFIVGLFCLNLYAQSNVSPQMIEKQCMYCHSDPKMFNVPMLNGQNKEFLEFELFNFRDFVRDDEIMNQVMENYTDDEVKQIAAYISGLSLFQAQTQQHPDADVIKGKQTFSGSCFECHQKDTSGIGPVLHGQKTWYLENAIKSFQTTWYNPRPSRFNMKDHTDMLSEQDIKDVAAYLNEGHL